MGWSYDSLANNKTNAVDYVSRMIDKKKYTVIKAMKKGNTVFLAVRTNATGEVVGVVALIKLSATDFGVKIMSEKEGPYHYGCPKSVLDLLTPTDHEFALKWRKGCVDHARIETEYRSIKKGVKIKTDTPISFKGYSSFSHFTCLNKSKNHYTTDTGLTVKLSKGNIQDHGGFEIVK